MTPIHKLVLFLSFRSKSVELLSNAYILDAVPTVGGCKWLNVPGLVEVKAAPLRVKRIALVFEKYWRRAVLSISDVVQDFADGSRKVALVFAFCAIAWISGVDLAYFCLQRVYLRVNIAFCLCAADELSVFGAKRVAVLLRTLTAHELSSLWRVTRTKSLFAHLGGELFKEPIAAIVHIVRDFIGSFEKWSLRPQILADGTAVRRRPRQKLCAFVTRSVLLSLIGASSAEERHAMPLVD